MVTARVGREATSVCGARNPSAHSCAAKAKQTANAAMHSLEECKHLADALQTARECISSSGAIPLRFGFEFMIRPSIRTRNGLHSLGTCVCWLVWLKAGSVSPLANRAYRWLGGPSAPSEASEPQAGWDSRPRQLPSASHEPLVRYQSRRPKRMRSHACACALAGRSPSCDLPVGPQSQPFRYYPCVRLPFPGHLSFPCGCIGGERNDSG